MSAWQIVAVLAVTAVVVLGVVIWVRRALRRLNVILAQQREAARHIHRLVPAQRQSPDPFWAEFVESHPEPGGEDR